MGNPFYAPGTPGAKTMQKMAEEAALALRKSGNVNSNGDTSIMTTATSRGSNRSQRSSLAGSEGGSLAADSPKHSQQSFDQISNVSEESNYISDA